MSIPDDVDPDLLISRLAAPLAPAARVEFRRAAEAVLAAAPCSGEGALFRLIGPLQRQFFDPPSDGRAAWDIGLEQRASKLRAGPPLAHGRDRRYTRRVAG
jgi:hypothetical protein